MAAFSRPDRSDGDKSKKSRESPPAAGRVSQPLHVIGNRATGAAIQRKVGFEFEDRTWRTWMAADPQHVLERGAGLDSERRPAGKKEVLDDHLPRLSVQADRLGEEADLEVVTEAFEETEAGLGEFITVMGDYLGLYGRLDAVAGQHTDDQPLDGSAVGFTTARARLSRGSPGGEIQMHATQGVPLNQIAELMQSVGSKQPGEGDEDTAARRPMRELMYGTDGADEESAVGKILSSSPAAAAVVLQALERVEGFPEEGRAELHGLVSMQCYYARAFSMKTKEKVAKYRTMLMARVDFGAMFQTLPAPMQQFVRQHQDDFIEAITAALNSAREGLEDQYAGNVPLFRGLTFYADRNNLAAGTTVPFPEITLEVWIQNISNGLDLATRANAEAFADPRVASDGEGRRLRALGDMTSLDRNANDQLAIVENRGMHPDALNGDQVTAGEAATVAIRYFDYLKTLREARG